MKIALQGLGSVSYYLLEHLIADGAEVVGCDVDSKAIERAVNKYGIEIVAPSSFSFISFHFSSTVNPFQLARVLYELGLEENDFRKVKF